MKKLQKTLLALFCGALLFQPAYAETPNTAHSHSQGQNMPQNMMNMSKMHEQHQKMMEMMNAYDHMMKQELQALDKLKGEAKINKMADILKKMFEHQSKMHAQMGTMHMHMEDMHKQMMNGHGMMQK